MSDGAEPQRASMQSRMHTAGKKDTYLPRAQAEWKTLPHNPCERSGRQQVRTKRAPGRQKGALKTDVGKITTDLRAKVPTRRQGTANRGPADLKWHEGRSSRRLLQRPRAGATARAQGPQGRRDRRRRGPAERGGRRQGENNSNPASLYGHHTVWAKKNTTQSTRRIQRQGRGRRSTTSKAMGPTSGRIGGHAGAVPQTLATTPSTGCKSEDRADFFDAATCIP